MHSSASQRQILIVEDDPDIRESLRDAFEDEGYLVRCAENGRAGLESLRRHGPPAAVVLDLLMPVMTGNELYDVMQADPTLAGIPVIVSTSEPHRAPSGVRVVKKPVDLGAMLATIEGVC
ncbi:MAG TPA: response regulator [Dehalococcoidia bacterium]|nr:response regulator [Dehalococcoidia bacterium]